jgi:hypothetical protein
MRTRSRNRADDSADAVKVCLNNRIWARSEEFAIPSICDWEGWGSVEECAPKLPVVGYFEKFSYFGIFLVDENLTIGYCAPMTTKNYSDYSITLDTDPACERDLAADTQALESKFPGLRVTAGLRTHATGPDEDVCEEIERAVR